MKGVCRDEMSKSRDHWESIRIGIRKCLMGQKEKEFKREKGHTGFGYTLGAIGISGYITIDNAPAVKIGRAHV